MSTAVEYELPDNLTVANIHPVHEKLEALVDSASHDTIVVNAGAVQKIDAAGVQLLYAFSKAARERQMQISWQAVSAKLRNATDLCGVSQHIGFA